MQGRSTASIRDGGKTPSPLSTEDVLSILPLELKEQKDIAEYIKLIKTLPMVNSLNGPTLMTEILLAKDTVSRLHGNALCKLEMAYRERKQRHAIAKLDKAPNLLKARGMKPTDSSTSAEADRDQDYLDACVNESYWKAWEKYLKDTVETLQAAHDDAKKVYGNTADPRGSISSVPSGE